MGHSSVWGAFGRSFFALSFLFLFGLGPLFPLHQDTRGQPAGHERYIIDGSHLHEQSNLCNGRHLQHALKTFQSSSSGTGQGTALPLMASSYRAALAGACAAC